MSCSRALSRRAKSLPSVRSPVGLATPRGTLPARGVLRAQCAPHPIHPSKLWPQLVVVLAALNLRGGRERGRGQEGRMSV